jgi:hypothetical protein
MRGWSLSALLWCMRLLLKPEAMRINSLANSSARNITLELFNRSQDQWNHAKPARSFEPTILTQLREHVDITKAVDGSGPFVLMLVVGLLALGLLLFVRIMSPPASASEDSQDEEEENVKQLAERLRRYIRKLPVTRSSKTGKTKERYIAVLPGDPSKQMKRSDGDITVAQKWEGGKVAWWHDASAFQNREDPKGEVLLKSIVSADGGQRSKYDYCEVEINYTEGTANQKLLLFFPTQVEASEWAADFSTLMRTVRPSRTQRSSEKSPWRQSTAEIVRRLTSVSLIGDAVTSFHSTFLSDKEKQESETDVSESDSDRGN